MATNKFFKSLLFALTIAINSFGFCIQDAVAYPVFAQQNYSNPRAANGKLACANCHLNQKAIEIEAPQAVLPNSIFEVEIKVPYDTTKQQLGANGKKADLNVGGILMLPEGFKLAPKNQIPAEVKEKNKGVFISPYSSEFDNILVVGPIAGKTHQELIFPVMAPDPEKNSDIKYLTYPFYAGGNRGRGQVYPTGEKSNVNVFGANQSGQITEITVTEKGESTILILNSNGKQTSQVLPAGLILSIKQGQVVKADQPLNIDPNVGGFGQEESEIVLQNPIRIYGYLAFCFSVLITQIMLVLKKKQFEKVQAAELNF
jgi:apocytochrome f|uniref:Cytochrome f n=2 Tax=Phaeodactylum tricornutum TaxID=2850 RepID=CYF_PHATC|nr:cytochrome f [Phaeodactylum tricornutum]A0T0C9.1 RecName: Full=Cytochrome f; Flags: Precursor [Phaeodactylum tricornutum CCAP 1055/1]ABK20627.1 cytochrome f [Phaeodactylum tricornutum]QHR85581.1 cytochrome f [Phaeodactylum tricornutum]